MQKNLVKLSYLAQKVLQRGRVPVLQLVDLPSMLTQNNGRKMPIFVTPCILPSHTGFKNIFNLWSKSHLWPKNCHFWPKRHFKFGKTYFWPKSHFKFGKTYFWPKTLKLDRLKIILEFHSRKLFQTQTHFLSHFVGSSLSRGDLFFLKSDTKWAFSFILIYK